MCITFYVTQTRVIHWNNVVDVGTTQIPTRVGIRVGPITSPAKYSFPETQHQQKERRTRRRLEKGKRDEQENLIRFGAKKNPC